MNGQKYEEQNSFLHILTGLHEGACLHGHFRLVKRVCIKVWWSTYVGGSRVMTGRDQGM